MRISITIIGIMIAILLALATFGMAQSDCPECEKYFVDLINQARENPLQTAEQLGVDRNKVLEELPDLSEVLINGLPPLLLNEKLSDAAIGHSEDMMARGYYSHISPEGNSFADRIAKSGYLAESSGESLGMMSFNNLIKPLDAVRSIFENIFKDELKSSSGSQRNILSSAFEEIGVGLKAGTIQVGRYRFNVYILTCVFGKSSIPLLQATVLNLLNEARGKPLALAESLGLSAEKVLADNPDISAALIDGLPQLGLSDMLNAAGKRRIEEILRRGFVISEGGTDSPEQLSEVLLSAGYVPAASTHLAAAAVFDKNTSSEEAVKNMVESLFLAEIDPGRTSPRLVLSDDITDIFIDIALSEVSMREGEASSFSYVISLIGASNMAAQIEAELLLLINTARKSPLEAIEVIGSDPEEALQASPILQRVVSGGLPDLWPNELLFGAARRLSLDISNGAVPYDQALDSEEHAHRVADAGYEAASAAGISILIDYSQKAAAQVALEIFSRLYRDEFFKTDDDSLTILNPNFLEIGLRVLGGGIMESGANNTRKGYIITSVYYAVPLSAVSPRERAESLFLELVNEARENPLAVATALHIEVTPGALSDGDPGEGLGSGLPSLYMNNRLWGAAQGHSDDMALGGYLSHYTQLWDGELSVTPGSPSRPVALTLGYWERIIDAGYLPVACGEYIGAIPFLESVFPDKAVLVLFETQFKNELDPAWEGKRLILDPDFEEIGIGLAFGKIPVGDSITIGYAIAVDFASSSEGVDGASFMVAY